MHGLRASWVLLALPFLACSTSSPTSPVTPIEDASQPPQTKFEAGVPCATDNDCEATLVCRHPVTACNDPAICVAAPPSPCDRPQVVCSCLDETETACDGYAVDPIASIGACGDGGLPPASDDAAADGPALDATVVDSAPEVDATADVAAPDSAPIADAAAE